MDAAAQSLFEHLAVSLALGMLVGLQRQYAASVLAGLRTFPMVSVLGTLAAVLDLHWQTHGLVIAAGLLALVAVVAVSTWAHAQAAEDYGITTEVALLLMYVVGAYLVEGHRLVAIAVGCGVAVLLQFKPELHGIVARLGDKDLRAIMQFALITGIILPLLPDKTYGPFDVLNPYEIWLMVVLIVGISLGGYIIYKFFGQNAGLLLGGILGGAISSTATTVSFAKRTIDAPAAARPAALIILIASTIVYGRVLIEISAVAPGFLPIAAGPIAVVAGAGLLVAMLLWFRVRRAKEQMPPQSNPSELKSAITFATLYAGVRLALAATRHFEQHLGDEGLYAIALLSGLTDMDAITLSTARMVETTGLEAATGWRLIIVASVANLAFKTGIVATIGSRELLRHVLLLFAAPTAVGLATLVLWPA